MSGAKNKCLLLLMGGPGGLGPPGGGVTGAAPPLRGAPEARRAVGRGETSPLLISHRCPLTYLEKKYTVRYTNPLWN
jgi:hypothetical protein